MNDNQPNHDWHDALIDRGLQELVGGETPPDLSERILAAAQENSAEPVTLASGEPTMNTKPRWALTWKVLAASVAVIGLTIGLLLPHVEVARHSASNRSLGKVSEEKSRGEESQPNTSDSKGNISSNFTPQESLGIPGLINDGYSKIESEGDSPQMLVTPRILIEEGAEERLSIDTGSPSSDSSDSISLPEHEVAPVQSTTRVSDGETVLLGGLKLDRFRAANTPATELQRNYHWGFTTPPSRPRGEAFTVDSQYEIRLGQIKFEAKEPKLYPGAFDNLHGTGPGSAGDRYTRIHENSFIVATGENAVSTFSIDVDTASYANVRQFLTQSRRLPPPDAVRIEELVNYFSYDYTGPTDDTPFASHVEVAGCPWTPEHRLVRIGIKGREIDRRERPQSNLVFLIDVSGSMSPPDRLPLLIQGMKLMTRELGENDRVAIVVYASQQGLALPSTPGNEHSTILAVLDSLRASGSTAGGAGIQLAYQVAQENFIEGGVNRIILCTDGDFNVGVTSTGELEQMAEEKARDTGIFLTVLGFGRGNLNDAMMEAISNKGNGNYHYIDNLSEARKVLVEELSGTLVTIAKDVKIQVEFNPAQVAGYRLIGYENRMLRTEDFNDDKKDAGEIGAGHTVTALYEIVPAGKEVAATDADPLKYQQPASPDETQSTDELLTLKIRYKQPDGDISTKQKFPITDAGGSFAEATPDFKFASAVASFGMLLRGSEHQGNTSYGAVEEIATEGLGPDRFGYRAEFLELVRTAKELAE